MLKGILYMVSDRRNVTFHSVPYWYKGGNCNYASICLNIYCGHNEMLKDLTTAIDN